VHVPGGCKRKFLTTVAIGTRALGSMHVPERGLTMTSEGLPVGPLGPAALVSSSLLHPLGARAKSSAASRLRWRGAGDEARSVMPDF
jgi:hypothetical protein